MVTDRVDALFVALADPTRRHVVQLLGSGPMRAGELADQAGLSAPAMSRHLRVLLRAGIVADERPPTDARLRVFHLRPQRLAELRAWLEELQTQWSAQLQSFQHHVERKARHD